MQNLNRPGSNRRLVPNMPIIGALNSTAYVPRSALYAFPPANWLRGKPVFEPAMQLCVCDLTVVTRHFDANGFTCAQMEEQPKGVLCSPLYALRRA